MSNVIVAHKHQWEMELARRGMERTMSAGDMYELAKARAVVAGLKALIANNEGIGAGLSEEQRAWLAYTINTDLQREAFLTA
jgi:hypothetical protein